MKRVPPGIGAEVVGQLRRSDRAIGVQREVARAATVPQRRETERPRRVVVLMLGATTASIDTASAACSMRA